MPKRKHTQSTPAAAAATPAELSGDTGASGCATAERSSSEFWKRGISDVKVGVSGSGDSILWRIAAFS